MKTQMFLAISLWIGLIPAYSTGDVPGIIEKLNSKDWVVRARGVAAAKRIFENEQIKMELIKLLERENQQLERHEEGIPAEDSGGEYYLELVKVVVRLKDPRAVKALAPAAVCGMGVTNALLNFGEIAIDPLMDVFVASKQKTIKQDIVDVTNRILKEKNVSSTHKKKVKEIFIQQINKTTNQRVRQSIIEGFDNFYDDDEVVRIVEKLTVSDTFYVPTRVKGRPRTEIIKKFTVRDEAQKTLSRIRVKRKEKGMGLPKGTTQQHNPH